MKFLHTADWHAGRKLKGVDRTPEIHEALLEIAELAKVEAVDAVLVAGDLFDKSNPPANAETAVYDFFVSLADADIPSIVIAGNHDSPQRLDALSRLLGRFGAKVLGKVRTAGDGGAFAMELAGETLQVAAFPFISERNLVRLADVLGADPGAWRQKYQDGMRTLVGNLTQEFSASSVNLLMMHTTMEGATLSNSEYAFYSTEDYTVSSSIIPESCSYVALGHLHKPQSIQGYYAQAGRYAGSLIQLDFGEAGEAKQVFVVEAKAGKPTKLLREYTIAAGKQLKQFRIKYAELERRVAEVADFSGYAKLVVELDSPLPGLKDRLRRDLPHVLDIIVEVPKLEVETELQGVDYQKINMVDAYAQYYQENMAKEVPASLKQAFSDLYEEVAAHETH